MPLCKLLIPLLCGKDIVREQHENFGSLEAKSHPISVNFPCTILQIRVGDRTGNIATPVS